MPFWLKKLSTVLLPILLFLANSLLESKPSLDKERSALATPAEEAMTVILLRLAGVVMFATLEQSKQEHKPIMG